MSIGAIVVMRPVKLPIEDEDEADRPEHRRLERHRAAPHLVAIQLNPDARRHCDQHGRVHEEELTQTGMPVVNMWCAQTMNERIAIDAAA
jgi:hypothetical protein